MIECFTWCDACASTTRSTRALYLGPRELTGTDTNRACGGETVPASSATDCSRLAPASFGARSLVALALPALASPARRLLLATRAPFTIARASAPAPGSATGPGRRTPSPFLCLFPRTVRQNGRECLRPGPCTISRHLRCSQDEMERQERDRKRAGGLVVWGA